MASHRRQTKTHRPNNGRKQRPPSYIKAGWAAFVLLILIYGSAVRFMFTFSSDFGYGRGMVYLHLLLILTVVIAGISVLLVLPFESSFLSRQRMFALFLTLTPALLTLLYASCYVSNTTWGENISLWVVMAQLRGIKFQSASVLPYQQIMMRAGMMVLALGLLSTLSYKLYRNLWELLNRFVDASPRLKLIGPGITLVLISALVWQAHASPWRWYGEPVTNFFGWPRVSSVMGYDAIKVQAALEDRAEASSYVAPGEFQARNIILIVADALRADHMGVYGYERDTTPFLRSLQEKGKLHKVQMALSTCSESYCGIATIMASRHFHQVSENSFKLYELLAKAGYDKRFFLTGDHSAWYYLQDFYGAAPGEIYDYTSNERKFDLHDDRLILDGLSKLTPSTGRPLFLYFFLMSTHVEGIRQEGFARWKPTLANGVVDVWNQPRGPGWSALPKEPIVNYYDGGVLQADHTIEQIFRELQAKGYLDDSIVVVTGDHGDGLGEHEHFGHTRYLYQEDIRVPLLIYDPEPSRYKNGTFATHVDIAPTIVDRLGLPVPKTWVGRSLLDHRPRDFSIHQIRRGSSICRALVHPDSNSIWKYIRCGDGEAGVTEEIFDLVQDPHELDNLVSKAQAPVLRTMRDALDQRFSIAVNRCPVYECK